MVNNPLYDAACEIQHFLDKHAWRSCIIGGLAVVRWGRPRVTEDVDISLFVGFGSEDQYVDTLLTAFAPRDINARSFALEYRVLLLQAANGIGIDIALAAFPFEERVIERASLFEFAPNVCVRTASAEDLIVLKSFAARDRDWDDVRGIVSRQSLLDWDCIAQELAELCQIRDEFSPLARLNSIRDEIERSA